MLMNDVQRKAQIDHILEELAKKRSLTAICAEDRGMPPVTTFLGWVAKYPEVAEGYACAREAQITGLLEETLEIAESATDDAYIVDNGRGKVAKIRGRAIRRAQLIIETRERFAKMMMPDRFNTNRTDITSGGKALPAPVQQNDNRIQALLVLAAQRAAALGQGPTPTIDVTPLSIDDVMK
jgi:hypothetical protein